MLRLVCPNERLDLTRLAKELNKLSPELIVMEATGGYETLAAITFTETGLPFAIVFPRRVCQLALGLGVIAKTDEIDAKVIAYYGRVAHIEPKPLESNEPNSALFLTKRSPLSSVSHLSLATPESSAVSGSAKAAETPSAARSIWPSFPPPDSIP